VIGLRWNGHFVNTDRMRSFTSLQNPMSIDGPAPFIETNIVGTYTLLEITYQYWQSLEVA